jgi:O-methyltransferase
MNFKELIKVNLALLGLSQVDEETLLNRFSLLRRAASYLLPEYRFKWPQMDWWNDRNFINYLKKFDEDDGNNSDRRFAVQQLLRLVEDVDGDTAEVGAYQGAMSWLICNANGLARIHHIFDSFEGLSEPSLTDGSHWSAGALACSEELVNYNLSKFGGRFRTYKGWVPSRFIEVENLRFSFVHVDVDLYEPTKASIEFFYPRLNPGGIIVCDDYGFTSCPGATKACDEFLADKVEKMIGCSAGGGFLIRGVTTAGTTKSIRQPT